MDIWWNSTRYERVGALYQLRQKSQENMKKTFCKVITLVASYAISVILLSPVQIYATENFAQDGAFIYSDTVDKEAQKEALKNLNSYAATIYQSEYFETKINQNDDFVLGDGFYQYFERNGELEKSDVIVFPVYQNDEPVFTIDVAYDNGQWYSSAGTGLVDELTGALNNPGSYVALLNENKGSVTIEKVDEDIISDENKKISIFTGLDSQFNKKVENDIFDILNPVQLYGIGFSTDQPNHKEIRMDNCIVIQPVQNGQVLGLCWASSAGTIIRQQTGNRTIDAWQIANEMGISPGTGVGVSTSRQVMVNHGCTIQYQALGRPAKNYTEVMHNVNNQFPIYMECMSPSGSVGHAVTLTGYDNSANQYKLQYFDGAENCFKITTYQGSSTRIVSFGASYYWNRSILIPLP